MHTPVYVTVSADQKPKILELVQRLPQILAGRVPDENGIATGFRTRIGYTIFSLIAPNFNEMGRGIAGVDGEKWAALSKEYLAYGRRFGPGEQAELRDEHGVRGVKFQSAPGDKKGLLTKQQLKLWRQVFAQSLKRYIMKQPEAQARAHAAAVAWIVVKSKGGKTKLEVYGNRTVQMLVDTGYMRASLQPGTLHDQGLNAVYTKPGGRGGMAQVASFDLPYAIIIGTNTQYAKYHHFGRGKRKRRLWPLEFPQDWWNQILGSALSGLVRIGELFGR